MQNFADLLAASGLTQSGLARLLGRDRVTVWRWVHGHIEPPAYAWTVLRQQIEIQGKTN